MASVGSTAEDADNTSEMVVDAWILVELSKFMDASPPTVTVCTTVVVNTCTLVAISVNVTKTGAVGHRSGVVVLFSEIDSVADGIEKLPVGRIDVLTLSEALGVIEGTETVVLPVVAGIVAVEFTEGVEILTDCTVNPVPGGAVVLIWKGGGTNVEIAGMALVVMFVDGAGRLPDGAEVLRLRL